MFENFFVWGAQDFVIWIGRGDRLGGLTLGARWMVDVLSLDEQWVDQVAVIAASGALDMLTAPQLRDAVQGALDKKPTGLIVDLLGLEFLGSAGMQVLLETQSQALEIPFAVVADGRATSRPLKITGVTDVVDVFSTLDAALANFRE